ncbi:hypothetical protein FCU94_11040 [Vibrio sp. JPW-9-11-11]|uniref:hypothetical protein n=1 Tax=Vibrio sp. JPW-9-11-11 TaxID=1416532 RepID=UPI001593E85C|nr:hypothetical protein [Vibrio sp. JPW-9-11-11]NVD07436.1 hypothetical protein [Vibrio sp. JPW-9-11-11]
MKQLALICLASSLLVGCSCPAIDWQQDQQAQFADTVVTMKSSMWMDMMPSVGVEQETILHGSVLLESEQALDPSTRVDSISLQQSDQEWLVEGDALELRTHSPTQWEVVFEWQVPVDPERPIDVAVQLNDQQQSTWLVNKQVSIDKVY